MAALKDELGDLLLQVVFHARMAEEAGLFGFDDVAAAIADKMVRRHPHVFGDAEIASRRGAERGLGGAQGGRARGGRAARKACSTAWRSPCPRLLRAAKVSRRAARIGFDWPDARAVLDKIAEEIAEIEAAIDGAAGPAALEEELGDLLFAAANLARKLDVEPETALRRATAKFERRFRARRGTGDRARHRPRLEALEELWRQVKAERRARGGRPGRLKQTGVRNE